MGLRPGRAAALVVLAVVAVAATSAPATAPEGDAPAPALAPREAYLTAEIEAAKTGELYLVLDPLAPSLDLKCQGVLLHRFPLAGARFAPPPRSSGPVRWPAVAFQLAGGLAERDRPLIEPPPPGADDAPAPPQEPTTPVGGIDFAARQRQEILHRAPPQYLLTFAPDLEVSVQGVAGAPGAPAPSLAQRLDEGWRRLRRWFAGPALPPRVTLEIPEEEARRLFLDLEPQIRLLVAVPPDEAKAKSG
jgi:hypothetical protein